MDPYDELADFLARGPSTREIADHHLSEEASRYLEDLVRKEKVDRLTDEEHRIVERSMQVERLMTMVKAKARKLLRAERREEPAPTAEVADEPAEPVRTDGTLAAA